MKPKTTFLLLFTLTIPLLLQAQPDKASQSFQTSFVKVSSQNPFYFELTNGETYIPIGANLCWAKEMEVMESYFRKLSENGGNYARIWLNFPGHEVETEYGKENEANLKNLDRILGFAVKYKIKIKTEKGRQAYLNRLENSYVRIRFKNRCFWPKLEV